MWRWTTMWRTRQWNIWEKYGLKTKEWKESCKCDTLSLKRINVSCHKRTIISESESVPDQVKLHHMITKEVMSDDIRSQLLSLMVIGTKAYKSLFIGRTWRHFSEYVNLRKPLWRKERRLPNEAINWDYSITFPLLHSCLIKTDWWQNLKRVNLLMMRELPQRTVSCRQMYLNKQNYINASRKWKP